MKMYRILLVDDEPAVVKSLSNMIGQFKLPIVIGAVARSGLEALELLQQSPFDIVITDIRMAGMDGLSLCQHLNDYYPGIIKIIMSGYAEFSYAQKAINYGAIGYCLKPVENQELFHYLSRAIKQLSNTAEKKTIASSDDLMESFYEDSDAGVIAVLRSYGLDSETFYVAATSGHDVLPKRTSQICVHFDYQRYFYISVHPFSLSEIQDYVNQSSRCKGFCCSREPLAPSALLKRILKVNDGALQFFIDKSYRCLECHQLPTAAFDFNALSEAANAGNAYQVLRLLRMALTERKNFTIRGAWKLFYILSSSNAYATALSLQNVSSPNQMVLKYGSFSNMLEQLQQLVTGVVVNNEEPKTIANATFLNMLKFINANFTKGLTLQEVANEMNMNPNYLSVIFKREMNVTFSTYITELRITEAKALLKNKDLSISEIATQLGFNDYFYFLKTFKRITGITPKQYRNPEKAPDPGLSLNTQENE